MANFRQWTVENRRLLYRLLKERFGAYSSWATKSHPEDVEGYKAFLDSFASFVTLESGKETSSEAVKQQIAWATTSQKAIQDTGHIGLYLGNVFLAYAEGFIGNKDLPTYLLVDHKKSFQLPE